jgi:hypothetical protein
MTTNFKTFIFFGNVRYGQSLYYIISYSVKIVINSDSHFAKKRVK